MPISVALGNTAPTTSSYEEVSRAEAEAAGPLGRREADRYLKLVKSPAPGLERSVAVFAIPDGYSVIDAVRDVKFAYVSQHSDEPPAWIECSDPVVGALIKREFESDAYVGHTVLAGRPKDWGAEASS